MSDLSIDPNAEETRAAASVNPTKLEQFMREAKARESLPLAILGGLVASIVAAIIWSLITYATKYQIGFMAIGVGFLVGYTVNFLGKGFGTIFGIVGAVFSLFGCLLGNLLTVIIFAALNEGVGVAPMLLGFLTSPNIILEIFTETFSPIDLLFYAIAVYEGFKFSMRQISDEEYAGLQDQPIAPPADQPK